MLDDYNDVMRIQVERPELGRLFDSVAKANPAAQERWGPLSDEEKLARTHLMMVYGLLERVYLLYDKGWIDEDTWAQWEAWLVVMARYPMFARVHRATEGMFDRGFQERVSRFVGTAKDDT